jgi:hypothetical protein
MPNTDTLALPASEPSDVEADALVKRAREILSGVVKPPPLAVPPEVSEFLTRQFEGRDPPPTPAALHAIAERLSLRHLYRGEPIAYLRTDDGGLAVLASGDEVVALYRGLSDDEAARVSVIHTGP